MGPAAALAACCLAGVWAAAHGQQLSGFKSIDAAPAGFSLAQKSVSYQDLGYPLAGAVFEIPANDSLIVASANLTQYSPDQVHITLGEGTPSSGSVWASWATGFSTFVANMQAPAYPTSTIYAPQTPDLASVASQVFWGTTKGGPYPNVATGYARAYIQTYLHDGNTYVSNLLHHVHVTGLPFGAPIYYKVGDSTKELSAEFTALLPTSIRPQTYTYPMRMGVVADVGQTYNSSVTYQHLVADSPDVNVFIGDLSYADNYNDRGGDGQKPPVIPPNNLAIYANTSKSLGQTYQPRWETMARLLQRVGGGTSTPYLFAPGNHEIERDEYLRPFQGYTNRFRHSYEASYSQDPLYYSTNAGPAHIIMLNAYDGFLPNTTIETVVNGASQVLFGNQNGPAFEKGNYPQSTLGAEQLSWFLNDLARVNRAVTPWVIVAWHQPAYNSYSTHYKEADCLLETLEPFMYNAGVDIVLHGHVHAYERVYQTYGYQPEGCAPRFLTMGDGGNQEGLYRTFAATSCSCSGQPACPCANVSPSAAPAFCTTLQNGLFAPINGTQPSYSAYREPSFGHGIIDFLNSTHALWTWNRNQDSVSVTTDSVYFVRNPACPNFKAGTPLPTTQPPATSVAPPTSTLSPTAGLPPKATLPPTPGLPYLLDPAAVINNVEDVKGQVAGQVIQGVQATLSG